MGIKENILYLSGLKKEAINENSSEEKEIFVQSKLLKAFEEFIRSIRNLKYEFNNQFYYSIRSSENSLKTIIKDKENNEEMKEKLYKITMENMNVVHKVIREIFGKNKEEENEEE